MSSQRVSREDLHCQRYNSHHKEELNSPGKSWSLMSDHNRFDHTQFFAPFFG